MVILSAVVFWPDNLIAALGIAIIALHNLTDVFRPQIQRMIGEDPSPLLKILYFDSGVGPLGILYVLIPWCGVMMAGYAAGRIFDSAPEQRRRSCLIAGSVLTIAFIILRWIDGYGDPRHWHNAPSLLKFLGTTKYPASLQFLLMTLGPMFIILGAAESWRGRVAHVLTTFGRVPMFYYLLHIPLIHIAACVVSLIREGKIDPWLFGNFPLDPPPQPPGYMWSLPLLYLVFAICVTALYFPCRWYSRVRPRHRWLRYI